MRRALVAAALAAVLVLPAAAAARVRVTHVDTAAYPELRVTVVGPRNSASPRLWENGRPAQAQAAANLGRVRSLVLAVDDSRSMRGAPLRDATAAARAFVASKAAADRIAVIAFGHRAVPLTRFSASTIDADAALREVAADATAGTALYDSVVLAAKRLGRENRPGRVIVVLTDGRDVSSAATLDEAIDAARRVRAPVYPIAIAGGDFSPAPLRRLARETGGTYRQTTSSADIAGLYAAIGRELAQTWQVRYVTAARPDERVRLTVTIPGAGGAARVVALPSSPYAPAVEAKPSGVLPAAALTSTAGTLALSVAVGLLILLACAAFFAARNGSWVRGRLDPHLGTVKKAKLARRRDRRQALRKRAVAAVEDALGNLRQFRRLQKMIERADLPIRAPELLAIGGAIGAVLGLFAVVTGLGGFAGLILFALGSALPVGYVAFRAQKRLKEFENQLPDLLITLAASLKAGHSFRQGIQSIVDEGQPPAAVEFRRVLTETKLGRPMDDALSDMADRVGSNDFTFVITAVTIQRQIGGSLAGLFDMVAETVRQRQQFARKVRSLTAMGRMSAYTLIALPFGVGGLVGVLNPGYIAPLFDTSVGRKMSVAAVVMMGVGTVILKKIVSFRG